MALGRGGFSGEEVVGAGSAYFGEGVADGGDWGVGDLFCSHGRDDSVAFAEGDVGMFHAFGEVEGEVIFRAEDTGPGAVAVTDFAEKGVFLLGLIDGEDLHRNSGVAEFFLKYLLGCVHGLDCHKGQGGGFDQYDALVSTVQ